MDRDSLMLAIQLQQQDLNSWGGSSKSKQRAGELSDADLAMQACCLELEAMATLISDHGLGLSIAQAVEVDAGAITEIETVEKQASRDHEFAMRLSTDPHTTPLLIRPGDMQNEQSVNDVDDDLLERLKAMNFVLPVAAEDDSNENHLGLAESSS